MAAGVATRAIVTPARHGSPARARGLPVRPSPLVKVAESSRSEDFFNGRVVLGSWRGEAVRASVVTSPGRIKLNPTFGKSVKWWEKGVQPNMREVQSAQDLADSLVAAGDSLVILDFFSPGCGGCKALHPKICQFAERNPDVVFLQVNHDEHKSMCYSLHVHVLPFFRFYRGADGKLCSFSCTNATIKKFKDALAKYTPERCSLGPTKGLEESELLALAANKDLNFIYTKKEEPVPASADSAGSQIVLATPAVSFPPAPVYAGGSQAMDLVVQPRN